MICFLAASTRVALCFHFSRAARLKTVETDTSCLTASCRNVGRSRLVSYSSLTSSHSCSFRWRGFTPELYHSGYRRPTSSVLPVGRGAIAAALPETAGVGSLTPIAKGAGTLSILNDRL